MVFPGLYEVDAHIKLNLNLFFGYLFGLNLHTNYFFQRLLKKKNSINNFIFYQLDEFQLHEPLE